MYYALLIFETEEAYTLCEADGEAWQMVAAQHRALQHDSKADNTFVATLQLQLPRTGTSLRIRDGEVQVTDGPFIESKELLVGFYVMECASLDGAIEYAKRIPSVEHGVIEVRPVDNICADEWHLPGEPQDGGTKS